MEQVIVRGLIKQFHLHTFACENVTLPYAESDQWSVEPKMAYFDWQWLSRGLRQRRVFPSN